MGQGQTSCIDPRVEESAEPEGKQSGLAPLASADGAGAKSSSAGAAEEETVHDIVIGDAPPAKTARTSTLSREVAPEESQLSRVEAEQLITEAKQGWQEEQDAAIKAAGLKRLESELRAARTSMREDVKGFGAARNANRYGDEMCLPVFQAGRHVPVLGLINPGSGAMAGLDILSVCANTPYYQDRIFDIIRMIKNARPGGLLDVFRIELCKAKDEAKALGTRPRVISGGGDGTGSFTLFMLFLALRADPRREALEGVSFEDRGNGYIWTDEELAESFPAIVQMPLGSANDFANILGWGQKYPGNRACPCTSHSWSAKMLGRWFEAAIDPQAKVVNFDIWGIMPQRGQTACDFKIAELSGPRGRNPNRHVEGKRQIHLKEADKPVPLFVCLYFSTGFGAYMTARFQLNRHKKPIFNRMEYCRQGAGLVLESVPPQMCLRLENVEIDCEGDAYFPPRRHRGTRGRGYREVGFYNINWQAHALHGADRASLPTRLSCCSAREPVRFCDGKLDMFRWKFGSLLKNPGLRIQTDKRKDMLLRFKGGMGKGIFFQWDGEARFAFSPTGADFHINIRRVLNIPVVLGPYHSQKLTGEVDNGAPVRFAFCGDTDEDIAMVKERISMNVSGRLDQELIATPSEIEAVPFPTPPPKPPSTVPSPRPSGEAPPVATAKEDGAPASGAPSPAAPGSPTAAGPGAASSSADAA